MELSTAALAAVLAASFVVFIASLTGAMGHGPPGAARGQPRDPRTPHPVQRRAELPRHQRRSSATAPRRKRAAPAPAPAPSPAAPVAPLPAPAPFVVATPAAAVTAYYAALDGRRFREAWRALRPAVQSSFGGFASWRAGFATTLSSRPTDIRVARSGSRAVVTLVLVATDRSPHGPVRRSFDVRWELSAGGQGWTGDALTATERSTRG